MSLTDSSIRYDFQFIVNSASTMNEIAFQYLSRGEMTDAMALELAAAVKGLGWPAGTTVDATIMKHDVTEIATTADFTAAPPAFT